MEKRRALGNVPTVIAIAALVALAAWGVASRPGARSADTAALTFATRRGPLTISFTEAGTIRAQDQVIIKNEVPGNTTILSLVPEGTLVKKGDLLVELDSSKLSEEKFEQELKVQNAESAYIRAREELAIVSNQATSDVEKAQVNLTFAQMDRTSYSGGEYPQELKQAEAKIRLTEEEVQRAEEKLKWSRRLHDEQYISQSELQADELAQKKAALDLDLAKGDLDLLQNYEHRRQQALLESDVKQAEMALERALRKARANVVQAETDMRAKQQELDRQRSKLKEIEEQIAATRILAPADGLAVYATSVQRSGWRGSQEPLAEGQEVRERQELIYLPATSKMMAAVKIHETNLKKIDIDMPVRVTIDALPGSEFSGRVARIAPLPDPTSFWMNPDLKEYDTHVHIDGDGSKLRNGMTGEVEIVAKRYEDAVYVPVQSVVRIAGKPTVYVVDARGNTEERIVELGLDNNRMVHVTGGLEEGEQVLLTPPLHESEAPQRAAAIEQPPVPAPPAPRAGGPGRRPQGERPRPAAGDAEKAKPEGQRGSRTGGRPAKPAVQGQQT